MTEEDRQEILKTLTSKRDQLQQQMDHARKTRMQLQLSNRDKYAGLLQKIGELSFLVGAAIAPIIIVGNPDKISSIDFAITGSGLYLLNGLLALWLAKNILEQDAEDTPFIGH